VAIAQEIVSRPALVAEREPVMIGASAAPTGMGPWGAEAAHGLPAPEPAPVAPEPAQVPSDRVPPPVAAAERPLSLTEQALVDGNDRDALNRIATDMGIEGAERLRSKTEVARVIAIRREMMAS
jgi:hypothetical protein